MLLNILCLQGLTLHSWSLFTKPVFHHPMTTCFHSNILCICINIQITEEKCSMMVLTSKTNLSLRWFRLLKAPHKPAIILTVELASIKCHYQVSIFPNSFVHLKRTHFWAYGVNISCSPHMNLEYFKETLLKSVFQLVSALTSHSLTF